MSNPAGKAPRLVVAAETGASPSSAASRVIQAPLGERTGGDRQNTAALTLLQLQAELRKAKTRTELGYFAANEARTALRAQQIVVLERRPKDRFSVHTVSSLTSVDRSSPLVLWFEATVAALQQASGLSKAQEFDAGAFQVGLDSVQGSYPLRSLLWIPWIGRDGKPTAGMLLARSTPWTEHDIKIAGYLAGALAHAWCAFDATPARGHLSRLLTRRLLIASAAAALALLAIPVPMTALAPVEVSPRETFVVTPGVEGVVKSVDVDPNAPVKSGQLLVTLADTVLRNRADIAEREVQVADTRYKKAAQLAFVDARGRHEMAIAKSELDLKLAERDYARELLSRTEIRAERDGVAFFADKKDLVGRPVAIGEKLMEVASPEAIELHIDLPAADAIVIKDEARVKVFLDSDPLNPFEATLTRASYKAAPREAQQFAFRLVAKVSDGRAAKLRLGARGTAQVFSDRVPLGFYLFRRPIAAARQWTGL